MKNGSKPNTQNPKEQAQRLLQEAAKLCHAEIEASLKKHGCKLIGIPGMVSDPAGGWKIFTRVDIVPGS